MNDLHKRIGRLVIAVVFMGCVAGPTIQYGEEILTGTWKPEGSIAVYEIEFVGRAVKIAGHIEYRGKRLNILE